MILNLHSYCRPYPKVLTKMNLNEDLAATNDKPRTELELPYLGICKHFDRQRGYGAIISLQSKQASKIVNRNYVRSVLLIYGSDNYFQDKNCAFSNCDGENASIWERFASLDLDGDELDEVFVHFTSLGWTKSRYLTKGLIVQFDARRTPKGWAATSVKLLPLERLLSSEASDESTAILKSSPSTTSASSATSQTSLVSPSIKLSIVVTKNLTNNPHTDPVTSQVSTYSSISHCITEEASNSASSFKTKEARRTMTKRLPKSTNSSDPGSNQTPSVCPGLMRLALQGPIDRVRCYNCGKLSNHLAFMCPKPPVKKRCHSCMSEQHLIAQCPLWTRKGSQPDIHFSQHNKTGKATA